MDNENKIYTCTYYDYIAQEDVVREISAKNLKEAYLIAYLLKNKMYNFGEFTIYEKCDNVYTKESCKAEATEEDLKALDDYWREQEYEDDM